jgi:hypothetical protein
VTVGQDNNRTRRVIDPRRIEVVDDDVVRFLRDKTPAERIAIGFAANRTVRLVIEGALRSDHPQWTDSQIRAEVAQRMLNGTT